ncbi:hypothetical protein CBL_05432 [Carabus blaptoides fortunei]
MLDRTTVFSVYQSAPSSVGPYPPWGALRWKRNYISRARPGWDRKGPLLSLRSKFYPRLGSSLVGFMSSSSLPACLGRFPASSLSAECRRRLLLPHATITTDLNNKEPSSIWK